MSEWARLVVRLAVVPVLVVAVASINYARFERIDQSSWVGGGFGMFATYDNETTRWIRVYDAESGEPIGIPTEFGRAAHQLRVSPSRERAERLARRLRDRHPDASPVRLEVWSLDFDHDGPTIGPHLLLRATVPAGETR